MTARPTNPGAVRLRPFALTLLLWLAGCLPIPNVQLELRVAPPAYRVPPSEVSTEYVVLRGFPDPGTPAELNAAPFLRYHLGEDPDTILVLMPGIFGGAASFDQLARQLVAATPHLEVWAVDRRSNLLEDRGAVVASLAARDPGIAYRYYLEGWGRPDGFTPLDAEAVPYMRRWGLRVHLFDLHRVVLAARERAGTVVLGGHSLGASLASLYAAAEVARSGARYGQDYIDGLVLFDGALGRTGGFAWADEEVRFGPVRLAPSVQELAEGRGEPFSTALLGPRYQVVREVAAVHACLAPDDTAPPLLSRYPATNLAVAGLLNDDEYGPVPMLAASLGHAEGAEFSGNITAVLLGGLEGVRSRTVSGVAEGAERVTWAPGNPAREWTDLRAYLGAWCNPDTNHSEWYFPLRLALDMALLPPDLEGAAGFLPNRLVTTPTLAFGAGRGLVNDLDGFRGYANSRYGSPISAYVLEGLTHMDVITARANPVVPVLQRWLAYLRP